MIAHTLTTYTMKRYSNGTSPANADDTGLISGWGRSPGIGNSNLFQYSCLENSMDRGEWRATVNGITKSET